jgi:hypothetical protein
VTDATMNRSELLSALLTKRGVILMLVVGAALLGAGFGILPGLLGDADDAEVSPTETPRQSEEAVETATDRDEDAATTERTDSETASGTGATEASGDASDANGDTVDRTWTAEGERTTKSTTGESPTTRDWTDLPTGDKSAEVDMNVEANVSVASLADYPTRSRRLNAVVNPPNTARTAGGA